MALLNCLRKRDARYEFQVCEFVSKGSANKESAREMGVSVLELRKRGVNPSILLDLLRTARAFRADVIQGFELETDFYATLVGRLLGARVAVSFPGMVRAFRWQAAPFLYFTLLCAHRIVCASSAIGARCRARAPWLGQRLEVIPTSVDVGRFRPQRARVPREGRMIVTQVANFHSPAKGQQHLLRAVSLLGEDEVEAWLVGDGRHMEEMQGLARELGVASRVKFWGRRSDVAHLLSESDVFVLPSLSEGLPNALLEAMASEVPVIATSVGGVPEVVRNRVTGLLVPPGDPVAIRDRIRELAGDPLLRRRLSSKAARHVAESFDAGTVARRYEKLYEGLARS